MDSEEPPTRHFLGCIGDKPEQRWRHNFGLDQLGAIEARFVRDHWGIRHPAWDQDIHRHPGALKVLRLDSAQRFERRLGRSVRWRGQPWRIISGTTAFVSASGAVVWTATKRCH